MKFIKIDDSSLPDKIAGEANLHVFHTHTRHFKYKSKIKNYVIN